LTNFVQPIKRLRRKRGAGKSPAPHFRFAHFIGWNACASMWCLEVLRTKPWGAAPHPGLIQRAGARLKKMLVLYGVLIADVN